MATSFPERRLHLGTLSAACLALALTGCGEGGGGVGSGGSGASEPPSASAEKTPAEPIALAAALPTDGTDPVDPATGNPFEVPDPDAVTAPDVPTTEPSSPAAPPLTPEGELPTHDPDGIPYCD